MITEIALAAVVAGLIVALATTYRRQRRHVSAATRAREEINREEHRMFRFLHGLGAALASDESASRMYEIIVHGTVNVTEAQGGALYLFDAKRQQLIPTHLSRFCPPLVPLPEETIREAEENRHAVGSYLRLAAVPRGEALIGAVFETQKSMRLSDLAAAPEMEGGASALHRGLAVMAAPLTHGSTRIGVLAVASGPDRRPFNQHEFDVFKSIAEQSAFALGNALIHKEAADKRRIEDELKAASEIQRVLLPAESPELSDYRVVGTNFPAKIVSGDYYDFIKIDGDHYGIAIADVSGKGIPASLIMAMCRSVLRAHAPGNHSPSNALAAVNRLIFQDIREDMFISMVYLVLDKNSNRVTLARAGHDTPLHYIKRSDQIVPIEVGGMAVGIDEGGVFERVTQDVTFTMDPGDALLLYTDGVTEALDSEGLEFGRDRLMESFAAAADYGADAVISAVTSALRDFIGDSPQVDDITLIGIEKR